MSEYKDKTIEEFKEEIAKKMKKEDSKYAFQNYGSFIAFFGTTAGAAATLSYSLPISMACAIGTALSFLYNLKTTNEFVMDDSKNRQVMASIQELYNRHPKEENNNYLENLKHLKRIDSEEYEQAKGSFKKYKILNNISIGVAVAGTALALVNPVAFIIPMGGVLGNYLLTKKEVKAYKKKEIYATRIDKLKYKIKIVEKDLESFENDEKFKELCPEYFYSKGFTSTKKEEKAFEVPEEEYSKMYDENNGVNTTSTSDKPKQYKKEKKDN